MGLVEPLPTQSAGTRTSHCMKITKNVTIGYDFLQSQLDTAATGQPPSCINEATPGCVESNPGLEKSADRPATTSTRTTNALNAFNGVVFRFYFDKVIVSNRQPISRYFSGFVRISLLEAQL